MQTDTASPKPKAKHRHRTHRRRFSAAAAARRVRLLITLLIFIGIALAMFLSWNMGRLHGAAQAEREYPRREAEHREVIAVLNRKRLNREEWVAETIKEEIRSGLRVPTPPEKIDVQCGE